MGRMIGLCDCNTFFVSCERVFQPHLQGKPVIVLSNNDGCAVALSNEAKALGFRRGDPYFKIKKECRRQNVAVLSGDHRLYADMSERVMATLQALSPEKIEIYSVDEAFIMLDTALGDLWEYGQYVVKRVLRNTGIPISLGIARTKTLAKVAAHFAKKYAGYHGACLMDSVEKERAGLRLTEIGDVWGIGRKQAPRLRNCGINTALDFSLLPGDAVRRMLTVTGLRVWEELNGKSCIEQELTPPERQTMTASRSFARELHSFEEMRQALGAFASIVGRKLRRRHLLARELRVFLCTNRFHEHDPQYYNTASVRLPESTDYTPAIAAAAENAMRSIYREEYGFKKAGITLLKLEDSRERQMTLFSDEEQKRKRSRVMEVIDRINLASAGARDCVRIASMGNGLDDIVRLEHSSRLYTTAVARLHHGEY